MLFQKNTSILLPQKIHFKIALSKIVFKNTCQIAPSKLISQRYVFISAAIHAVKNKADIYKNLMYGSILDIH